MTGKILSRRTLAALVIAAPLLGFVAILEASDSSTVSFSTNQNITAHSMCKKVTNNSGTGLSVYVPTVTSAEWSSFYTNPPSGVTLGNCGLPTHNGRVLYPDIATANRYCMDQSYHIGIMIGMMFATTTPTFDRYTGGQWTSTFPTGYFDGTSFIYGVRCLNTTSFTDITNPTHGGLPMTSDSMTENKYCQDLGYQLGGAIDTTVVTSSSQGSQWAYYSDGWKIFNYTYSSSLPGNKITKIRCYNMSSYTDVVNPTAATRRICQSPVGGIMYNLPDNLTDRYCRDNGYDSGVMLSTDGSGACAGGGPSAPCSNSCSYLTGDQYDYANMTWTYNIAWGYTNADLVRCFNAAP